MQQFRLNKRRILLYIVRLLLGAVLIYASMDKIAYPKKFSNIVIDYHILPERLAIFIAHVIPWAELIFGINLIVGIYVHESSFAAALLILLFIIALGLKGESRNCGCFPENSFLSTPNLLLSMLRDGILLTSSLLIFVCTKKPKED